MRNIILEKSGLQRTINIHEIRNFTPQEVHRSMLCVKLYHAIFTDFIIMQTVEIFLSTSHG